MDRYIKSWKYGNLEIRFDLQYANAPIDTIESCCNVFYEVRPNLNGKLVAFPLLEDASGNIKRLSKEDFLKL
ncbi:MULTISPECIES: hypothetical protein [Clostridia]|uniref:hypothetical protein n=1 Tax=Clostridia TaxID=186801 RepID=UPI002A88C327|nr:hypothetical protein [Peptostreptococcus porci]MDY5098765.1 hypothetical protein [Clostridium sp.]MDY5437430.1 hypothetical protein [Peptostreptococcus porci]